MPLKELQELAVDEAIIENGAQEIIENQQPYTMSVAIIGSVPLLFHRWNIEAIAEKATAAKGSKAKKSDNLESYVYRDNDGQLAIPGIALCAAIANAGKFVQDPRSPRKSLHDLCRAAIFPLNELSPFTPTTAKWDFEHAARVMVQRNGVTRVRPAMREGWRSTIDLMVSAPEYLTPAVMAGLIGQAGRLVGLLDFRPTYGRFNIEKLEVVDHTA